MRIETTKRRSYTEAFKREAVALVTEQGLQDFGGGEGAWILARICCVAGAGNLNRKPRERA